MVLSSLDEATIPPQFSKFISLEQMLEDIDDENINVTAKEILNLFWNKENYDELIANIIKFSDIRSHNQIRYAKLSKLLNDSLEDTFHETLLHRATNKFLRRLFLEKCFSIDEIKEKCKKNPLQYFFFAPELGVDFLDRNRWEFKFAFHEYNKIISSDWKKYNEYLDYGYEIGSLEYVIKYDKLEDLRNLSTNPKFNFNLEIRNSSFESFFRGPLISFAAYFGSVNCFRYLLLNKAKIDEDTCAYAARGGNLEIIHLCMQNGGKFIEALNAAAEFHRHDIFNWILMHIGYEMIPLRDCISYGNYETYFYYFENGLDVNQVAYSENAVHCAAKHGYLSLLKHLFENGASNIRDAYSELPLHRAAESGFLQCCLYLSTVSDINAVDNYENAYSALMLASSNGYYSICKILLENGASVNQMTGNKQTALHIASSKGYSSICELLLKNRADPNLRDSQGHTPLDIATDSRTCDLLTKYKKINRFKDYVPKKESNKGGLYYQRY